MNSWASKAQRLTLHLILAFRVALAGNATNCFLADSVCQLNLLALLTEGPQSGVAHLQRSSGPHGVPD